MDEHRTALVTGASRGLGRALALELAERGFRVIASMRTPKAGAGMPEEAARRGGRLIVRSLDVCAPQHFEMPRQLHVLVNNAGTDGTRLPVETQPLSEWRALFETNLFGLVAVTQRALPALRAAGGVVCNVTSASLCFPMPFFAAYRASKAAVSALGESLMAELAPFGGRVLEVMPGPIETDMLAASGRPPEAAELPEYAALAARAEAGRRGVESQTTAPEVAARTIAAAIEDPGAPLRVACDPLGRGLIESWGTAPDAQWWPGALAAFLAGGDSGQAVSPAGARRPGK